MDNIEFNRPKRDAKTAAAATSSTLLSSPATTLPEVCDPQPFLSALRQCAPQAVIFTVTDPQHCDMMAGATLDRPAAAVCRAQTVSEVIRSVNSATDLTAAEIVDLMSKLSVSAEQIESVECNTRLQHQNPLWGQYRAGRLTASKFGAVIKCMEANRKPSPSLMKTLLGGYNAAGAKAIQWGTLHERTALAKYEAETGNLVKPSGLWLHQLGFCGASPDGVVDDIKTVEVKCPYSVRDKNVMDCIGAKFFLHLNTDESLELNHKHPQGHSYYHQIQGSLWLTGRAVCDLVVWTPCSTVILRVERDDQYEMKYFDKLKQFYQEYFLPAYIKHNGS